MEQFLAALKDCWNWLIGDGDRPSRNSVLVFGTMIVALSGLGVLTAGVVKGSNEGVGARSNRPGTTTTVGPTGRDVAQAPFTAPITTTTPASSGPGSTTQHPPTTTHEGVRLPFRVPVVTPQASVATVPAGSIASPAPATPTGVTVVQGKGWARVSWDASSTPGSAVTGFNVYVGTTPGGEDPAPANGSSLVHGTSYVVTHLQVGLTYYFTVRASSMAGTSPPSSEASTPSVATPPGTSSLSSPVVGMAAAASGSGYWLADATGDVSAHGDVVNYGSAADMRLAAPIVHIVATPDGQGYWLVGADGGVFSFGDAQFFGSMGGVTLNAPIISMAATHDGQGYWLVAADGGVFSFGDATFHGSMGGQSLSAPVVGMSLDPTTGGYWEVNSDGMVSGFDAPSFGSLATARLSGPVVGIAETTDGSGYWLVASDGGVFAFGDANFCGSAAASPLNAPVVELGPDQSTGGYWTVGADGGVFSYCAPFLGAA